MSIIYSSLWAQLINPNSINQISVFWYSSFHENLLLSDYVETEVKLIKKHLPVRKSVWTFFFMLVQTSDQQTTEQQLTTIDRYCSSVICHLEFLHVTFQQLSKLLCLHIIISTQKSLYLRFYHCLWQLLNCISIILKNVEKFVMQQLLVGVWRRVWSYSVWFVFPSS